MSFDVMFRDVAIMLGDISRWSAVLYSAHAGGRWAGLRAGGVIERHGEPGYLRRARAVVGQGHLENRCRGVVVAADRHAAAASGETGVLPGRISAGRAHVRPAR